MPLAAGSKITREFITNSLRIHWRVLYLRARVRVCASEGKMRADVNSAWEVVAAGYRVCYDAPNHLAKLPPPQGGRVQLCFRRGREVSGIS